jgi:hypothetical protein
MKNIFSLFIIVIVPVFDCISQEIIRNEEYINYCYNFTSLADDEVLTYTWDYFTIGEEIYTFKLFAENKDTMQKRVIGNWYVSYGDYQFSSDRKACVFFKNDKDYLKPLFMVDGKNGTIRYLINSNNSAITTPDLFYLLFHSGNDDPSIQNFILIDLRELKIVRRIDWCIIPRLGGGPTLFRSLNPEYDFRIDYSVERELYATCYYKISTNNLIVIFDDTNLLYERELKREPILPEELGL